MRNVNSGDISNLVKFQKHFDTSKEVFLPLYNFQASVTLKHK